MCAIPNYIIAYSITELGMTMKTKNNESCKCVSLPQCKQMLCWQICIQSVHKIRLPPLLCSEIAVASLHNKET